MAKTRLEFKDKTSQKFWEIDCKGNTITILYGKLGTSGQTSVKTLLKAVKENGYHLEDADKIFKADREIVLKKSQYFPTLLSLWLH